MGKLEFLKKLLLSVDLFYSSQVIRYNNESQYKTVTGGFMSLAIIIAVMIGFSNMIISSLERTSITSDLLIQKQKNPPMLELNPGKQHFMIGVTIQSSADFLPFDLNNGPQIFDITLKQLIMENGILTQINMLKLEQCTRNHWHMDPTTVAAFDQMMMGTYKCLELNSDIKLAGIYGSTIFSHVKYQIYPCKNTTENNNKCASQEQIDRVFERNTNFYISISFVNPVINPNQPKYIQYFLNSQNYFMLSKKIGMETWLQFTDFTIKSDNSILPFENIKEEKGFIAENRLLVVPYAIDYKPGDHLGQINIAKSTRSLFYNRQVLKISTVISYVGGMIGAIAALFFIVKAYANNSLEFAISLSVFNQSPTYPQDSTKKSLKFTFANYISFTIYKIVSWFKKVEDFEIPKRLQQYQDEINKQLDIRYLLKRILKLELFIKQFYHKDQIDIIKNCKTISCQLAKQLRTLLEDEEEEEKNKEEDNKMQKQDHLFPNKQSNFEISIPRSSETKVLNGQTCKRFSQISHNPLSELRPNQDTTPASLISNNDFIIQTPHRNRKQTQSMNKFQQMLQTSKQKRHENNQHFQQLNVRDFKAKRTQVKFSTKNIIQLRKQS